MEALYQKVSFESVYCPCEKMSGRRFTVTLVLSMWKRYGGGKKKCLYPSDVGDFTVNANTLNREVRLEEEVYPSCPREQCKSFQMLAALDLAQALGNGMN